VSDDDEAARLAEQKAREQHEADVVDNRIGELYENPIKGNFDVNHLKAVHRYIFQDLPHHQPGTVREDTESWVKHRALESRPVVYDVHYASQGIESKIADTLEKFGGPDAIKGLTPDAAATRLAELYGDLDHAHVFSEGNSRTLREFARELAKEAGFNLDWTKTGVGAQQRNELYIARDLAVLERAFPDLTEEKAMHTNDRAEYEAYCVMANLRNAVGDKSLDAIIRQGLSAYDQLQEDLRAAEEGAKSDDAPGKASDRGKGRGR
jgi:cell filamentation protein